MRNLTVTELNFISGGKSAGEIMIQGGVVGASAGIVIAGAAGAAIGGAAGGPLLAIISAVPLAVAGSAAGFVAGVALSMPFVLFLADDWS